MGPGTRTRNHDRAEAGPVTRLGMRSRASELRMAMATSAVTKATTGARFPIEQEIWVVCCYW